MSVKIKEILKEQKGSSLAFVIIIGVIIMIMVVSLLTVANSDFTFTQQTVESRQAYIDAKSVIEFGKIKINNDMKYLNEYELAKKKLAELEEIKKPTSSEKKDISDLKTKISSLEPKIAEINSGYPFNIYSDKNTVTGNLLIDTLNYDGTDEIVAKCTKEGGGTQYTFDIDVQGLRRDLDYKVVIPVGDSDILNSGSQAKNTNIHTTGSTVKINIKGEGNEKEETGGVLRVERYDLSLDIGRDKDNNSKFEWLNGKTLDLKAKNIYVTAPMPTTGVWQAEFNLGDRNKTDTIWFKQNYIQNSGSGMTNTFRAKNIIFDKNLTINDNTNLNIECDTLWVKGDVLINASGGTNSTLNVNARNIIVGDYANNTNGNVKIGHSSKINWNCSETIFIRGNIDFLSNTASTENLVQAKKIVIGKSTINNSQVVVKNNTKVIWDCNDFWLHGDMTTITSNSIQEFRNVEYFKSGNINLSDKCEITITGKAGSVNRIFVDGIIPQESNAYKLKIKGFEFFKCNGNFGLNQGSSLELEAQIIEILGNFTLSEQLGSTQNPLKIKTKYLDVIGNTIIKKAVLLIEGNSASAIRFNGGYDQMNSDIKINGADQVIFGGTVSFTHDNRWDTSVTARKIYFDSSNPIKFQQGGTFQYTGLNSDLILINFGSDVQSWFWATLSGDLISEGNYKSIVKSDIIPDNLEFQGGYTSPSWSNYPSSLLNEPTEPNVDFVWKEQQGKPGTEIYH